ncbi:aminopeptidase N-like isoform X2 [Cataglyphis hispanica]|uniref:aminopeptidase N-like isoform X2 n=1 Tax=Cataglyphis hispanica TaxID=1086592 RepID=UPI00217F906F|nr:aminopeptidase N-like isoform X2 [Cataglyphis hispanica]
MRSVTRDIIHQWFGNIFKPFCRSHRLLNEGFIMFFEIHVIEKVFPDSQITDLLIVQTQQDALYLNSYTAMNFFAKDTSSISEIYSHFCFSHMLGTALWRMLNSVLPRNSLWINLNEYLNTRFTYSNSTPNDLWSLIQTDIDRKLKNKLYNNLNIKQIMDIWTTQTSCPVVNVIRDYSHKYVKISKEIDGKLDRKPYFIPVSYTKETNIDFVNISPQRFDYLTQSNPEIKIDYDNEDKWFIANILQTGYYRVNYDTKNWRMIARYLNSNKYSNIHVISRAQIIDDAFHLAIEKKLDFSIFWELVSYLWRESNYVAWYPMIKIFERISGALAFSTTHEYFEEIKMKIESLFKYVNKNMYNQNSPIILLNDDLNNHLKQELTKWDVSSIIPCAWRWPKNNMNGI